MFLDNLISKIDAGGAVPNKDQVNQSMNQSYMSQKGTNKMNTSSGNLAVPSFD